MPARCTDATKAATGPPFIGLPSGPFGEIRPLMWKWVLPVYDETGGKLYEIVCDTREVAETAKVRMVEMDLAEFIDRLAGQR